MTTCHVTILCFDLKNDYFNHNHKHKDYYIAYSIEILTIKVRQEMSVLFWYPCIHCNAKNNITYLVALSVSFQIIILKRTRS